MKQGIKQLKIFTWIDVSYFDQILIIIVAIEETIIACTFV